MEVTYKVALVVGLATIVTEEGHGVALGNVLRVVLHELGNAVPKSGDGLEILVKAEHEAVLLLVLVHVAEGVVVDVAVELDARLDTPVVVVVHHKGLAEKEAGLETAHVAVADAVTVDDLALSHVLANLLGLLLVDVGRERPVLGRNLAIVRLAGNKGGGDLLEGVVERLIVEEDPVVVVAAVEAVLDRADRLCNFPYIGVASQGDKGGIHARAATDTGQVVPPRVVRGHGQWVLGRIVVGAVALDGRLVIVGSVGVGGASGIASGSAPGGRLRGSGGLLEFAKVIFQGGHDGCRSRDEVENGDNLTSWSVGHRGKRISTVKGTIKGRAQSKEEYQR